LIPLLPERAAYRGIVFLAAHLTQKLVRLLWAIGGFFFNVLYGLLTVVVIGRFIAPAELGAASTATAAVLLIEVVSLPKFRQSLEQDAFSSNRHLSLNLCFVACPNAKPVSTFGSTRSKCREGA
jgi:hypothetical protein